MGLTASSKKSLLNSSPWMKSAMRLFRSASHAEASARLSCALIKRAGATLAEYAVVLRVYGRLRGLPVNVDGDARKVVCGDSCVKDDATGDDHFGKRAPAPPTEQPVPAIKGVEDGD